MDIFKKNQTAIEDFLDFSEENETVAENSPSTPYMGRKVYFVDSFSETFEKVSRKFTNER